jgi:hypothetical protein
VPAINKPLALVRRVLIGLATLIAALVSCHVFLESDIGLLSDAAMQHIVRTRALGTTHYGQNCDEASYRIAIPPYRPSSRATEVVLTPVPGREQECPAFTMIIDRTSGELWRTDS